MNINASGKSFREADGGALVVAVFKDEKPEDGILKELDELTGGIISSAIAAEEIKGKEGETLFVHLAENEKLAAKRLLLIGVGAKEDYQAKDAAILSGTAARFLRGKSIKTFSIVPRVAAGETTEVTANAVQGVVTSLFELDKYRTKDKEERTIEAFSVIIEGASEAELNAGIARGQIIGDSMNLTRDMANEPSNVLTPTEMANRAQAMAAEVGLTCNILDEAEMERLGMGSLLSVSRGSEEPAKLIVLKYEPAENTGKSGELLALVGKGITFDTGGISIKPAENMDAMKYDMSGGATVIGTMRAIALLKSEVPVLGIIAASENMPSGKATKPGDVVTAMNGKTIEILNTDAEGRLVLADAVAYAKTQGATKIVDMATLTGAVIIALGDVYTAVLGDQELVDEVITAGKNVGEKFWQLPLDKEYFQLIKSPIADVKNIGTGRKAGTIIGAAFIKEFVGDTTWAHLDIAGTAWSDETKPFRSKGPTAIAVRTLINLVENSAKS